MGRQSDGRFRCPPPLPLHSPFDGYKDYYKVLDVKYGSSDDAIRNSYLRLALKWHPDKHQGNGDATAKFQEINEAYRVLSDPVKRQDYDTSEYVYLQHYSIMDYLDRFQGLILTCNGLGISSSSQW